MNIRRNFEWHHFARGLRAPATLALLYFAVTFIIATIARADVALPPPGAAGWRTLEFPKIPAHTRYEITTSDGVTGVKAISNCSASALYVPVENVDLRSTPRLHWRWKVEKGLEIANERVKSGDDFAARVYVMFRFEPERARATVVQPSFRRKLKTCDYSRCHSNGQPPKRVQPSH